MVSIDQQFDTKEAAEKWMESYLQSYHPAGYGTSLRVVPPAAEGGKWRVVGSRGSSCD